MQCTEYDSGGYPMVIDGHKVDPYRYVDNWRPTADNLAYLSATTTALQEAYPIYVTFGQYGFDPVMIYQESLGSVTPDGLITLGDEEEKSGTRSPCFVRISKERPVGLKGEELTISIKRTTIHEM